MERFRGYLPCSTAQRRLVDDSRGYIFDFGLEDGSKLVSHFEGRSDGSLKQRFVYMSTSGCTGETS